MQCMKLKLEDLHVGDMVARSSLDDIYNVYVTLVDSKIVDGDIIGRIAFVGKELGEESDRAAEDNDNICAIYHDPGEIEGDVTYDE